MDEPLTVRLASLREHGARLRATNIEAAFAVETDRLDRLSLDACGLRFDFAKEAIDAEALAAMLDLAVASKLEDARTAMFAGAPINGSEQRPVLHAALRWPRGEPSPFPQAILDEAHAARLKAAAFADALRAGAMVNADGAPIDSLLHIGIGGSDLGPRLLREALAPFAAPNVTLRTVANVDPVDLAEALAGLDPRRTLVVVVSKSFSTVETLVNLEAAVAWLQRAVPAASLGRHLAAVSSAPAKAQAAGVPAERVFPMQDGVGGRYSLWSPVSVAIEAGLQPGVFDRLLAGAHAMDRHFLEAPLARNAPVLAALIRTFGRLALAQTATAVIPYGQRLRLLPAFLQQLQMESNGKRVDARGAPLPAPAASIVFGEPGTLAQHSFFQMLHQGVDAIPVEFLLVAEPQGEQAAHRKLLANVLAQAEGLLTGRSGGDGGNPTLDAQRACPGGRPSTIIGLDRLDPESLGALLAFYEHRTFCEGALLGINSFDQWGVELGKQLALGIEDELAGGPVAPHDPSTAAWIARLRRPG